MKDVEHSRDFGAGFFDGFFLAFGMLLLAIAILPCVNRQDIHSFILWYPVLMVGIIAWLYGWSWLDKNGRLSYRLVDACDEDRKRGENKGGKSYGKKEIKR